MATYVKDPADGLWKQANNPTTKLLWVRVADTWRSAVNAWVRDAGTWKQDTTYVGASNASLDPPINFTATGIWRNNRYEVDLSWSSGDVDTVSYEWRINNGTPANIGTATTRTDTGIGTTGGVARTYDVRAIGSFGQFSPWVTQSVTTPGDAPFAKVFSMIPVAPNTMRIGASTTGAYNGTSRYQFRFWQQWDNHYTWTHRGNAWMSTQSDGRAFFDFDIAGNYDGTTNSIYTTWPNLIRFSVHTINSWGKPNGQAGNNLVNDGWASLPNEAFWRRTGNDGYFRIAAFKGATWSVPAGLWIDQTYTSVSPAIGVDDVRTGGGGTNYFGAYWHDENLLNDVAVQNRLRTGQQWVFNTGRKTDVISSPATIAVNFTAMKIDYAGLGTATSNPYGANAFVALGAVNATEGAGVAVNVGGQSAAFGTTYHGIGLYTSNTFNGYAEFGEVGAAPVGFHGGQLVIHSPGG